MSQITSCPVDHAAPAASCPVDHASTPPVLPPNHPPIPLSPADASSCPYGAEAQDSLTELNNMPAPNQLPSPGQRELLSTEREKSTIPMGGKHEGQLWVYPSEQ
ncbi:hypothetical protein BDK51DRAFT_39079, partial [Blyttiomyces helicus]